MKLNNVELKIGQWWVDETQSHLGIYHPFRVMDLWEEKNVWERRANGVSSSTFPQINHAPIWKLYRLATPAELTAAGVPDSQRLVEQRSEWSGVRLWIGDFCTRPAYCWFTIDHGGWRPLDGYVHEGEVTTGKDYIGKYDGGDCVEVTTDPRYAWVYQREDVLQAVVKFRSERREAGLKWCGVCGVIIKSNGSRAEFWNGAKWLETCRIDSGFDTVATPEQIAQSGVPLSDIPDPALRASVEKLRTSLSSSFTVECADGKTLGISADMQCGKPVLSVTELESPSPAATRTDVEGDTFSINSLDGNVYTLKAFIDRHGIARLDLNFTPADAPVDLELARAGIVRVREMISKCFRTDRTSDDLFELGLAIADVRKGLGLPSYLSTLTPSGDGETEK